jgi:hypothetical protein
LAQLCFWLVSDGKRWRYDPTSAVLAHGAALTIPVNYLF